MANIRKPTNYHEQANYFARLPEYQVKCGTDYLAGRDAPEIIRRLPTCRKILDLGCGTGLATRYLKKHFPDATIIGADINQSMLEQARTADPEGIYLHLNKSSSEVHYAFLPGTFDVIVCSFVFHENQSEADLNVFLKNISVLLRPNGLMLAWDTYKNLLMGKWTSIETLYPETGQIEDGDRYTVKLLPAGAIVSGSYWSPETVEKIARLHHFENVTIHYPLANHESGMDWLDETSLAPYYVIEAYKR